MIQSWTELITEYMIERSGNPLDFTNNAVCDFQEQIWKEEFEDCDSSIIYQFLNDRIRIISFNDYLKRYLYEKAELTDNYEDIDLKVYKDIIIGSFQDTGTPKSFRETSARLPALVHNWLTRDSVSRSTVFLLGFGLNMTVEDVSVFLKKALGEQDFNFNNPEEVIYWFSIKNHYGVHRAQELIAEYESLSPDSSLLPFDNRTVSVRYHAQLLPEDELIAFLRHLKSKNYGHPFGRTAVDEFNRLLGETKKEILNIKTGSGESIPNRNFREISSFEVERTIYNGIPLDKDGNLQRSSASRLHRSFSSKRLSRQRIDKIRTEKAEVDRYDLITLNFFIHSCRTQNEIPNKRFHQFITDTNKLLTDCYMGELNISNAYESFILMCLLTEWPLSAFNEVWEYSYSAETDL